MTSTKADNSARPEAFVTMPGGGSHIMTLLGFDAGVRQIVDVVGYSGTSAGGAGAVGGAFRIAPAKTRTLLREYLQDDRLLDINLIQIGDAGLCAWEVVPRLVDELIGKGVRLGDAELPLVLGTTDLDSGRARYFDSRNEKHKRVLVREIVRVMTSIPFIGPQLAIPSWMVGKYTPSIQLHTDGGVADNTVDAVFDADKHPRIAARLVPTSTPIHRVYRHTQVAQAIAVFRAMLTAAGELKSKRNDGVVVDVPAIGDGLDFSLTSAQLDERWHAGYTAARSARAALLALAPKGAT